MFDSFVQPIMEFVRVHSNWAIVIVFLMGFGECLVGLSILVPGTFFFVAFGAFAGAAKLDLLPLAVSAAVGSALGFWVSYEIGVKLGPAANHHWPFSKYPTLMTRTHALFEKWGGLAIVIGHFQGQIRPFIALVAGIAEMPRMIFHVANIAASALWGYMVLYAPGLLGQQWEALLARFKAIFGGG
jgi:membrane protein DedA with SNARE-associated domain